MKQIKLLAVLMALVLLCTSATKQKTTTIFIIGDSTAAKKDLSKGSPERGWGMALQCYFDDSFIHVDNHAVNGRSSKSFIDEGRWQKVLDKMQPGDYVIIQFGHNDEKPQPARHTEPGSTFDANLAKFVNETRAKGGIPILMNPVVRRNFAVKAVKNDDDEALRNTTFKDGANIKEGNVLVDTHGLYAVAPRNVDSKKLHMWYKPGEHPAIPDGKQDNTHYNIYGAHQVARLLADALCEEIPLFSKYRTNDKPCKMEQ